MIKHITSQPFIFATGLAALIHSTWSLGTLFAGDMPEVTLSAKFIFWLVPALLIAFAFDVGQINTAAKIRSGQRTPGLIATFIVLAAATFYLQFLYIVHHMPDLTIAAGAKPGGGDLAVILRDLAVWIVPALLPASTILYTLGDSGEKHIASANVPTSSKGWVLTDLPQSKKPDEGISWLVFGRDSLPAKTDPTITEENHTFQCDDPECGYLKLNGVPYQKTYTTYKGWVNGKKAHEQHHHPDKLVISTNGKGHSEHLKS